MSTHLTPWALYAAAGVLEFICITLRFGQRARFWLGCGLLLLLAASQGALVVSQPLLFGVPFLIIGLYRMLNCMRYIYGRMHQEYLYRVVPRSSVLLLGAQLLIGGGTLYLARHHFAMSSVPLQLAVLQVAVAGLLVWSLGIGLDKSEIAPPELFTDKKLPSVSVLIPARNETADLEACLQTVVASTYQKLEILVLDDCSQDRTSEVIKQFAHDGVRFIKGNEPGDVWLPKNAAYNKLAHEASGEFLLFCGVDVRLAPEDIRTLVSYALQQKMTMVSVLPRRSAAASPNSVTQQIRYLWELALPRFLTHRPPVLSTLWLIQATALKKYGGMGAVRRNVVPEGFFARELDKKGLYHFVRAGSVLGVQSMKPPAEQRDTALRVRYPQLHRRPEVVMAVTAFELVAIIGVYGLFIYALLTAYWLLVSVTILAIVQHLIFFMKLAESMGMTLSPRFMLQSLVTMPVDVWLMHRSMYLYEFDEVRWKERNVCLPVMHAVPSMPKLPRV